MVKLLSISLGFVLFMYGISVDVIASSDKEDMGYTPPTYYEVKFLNNCSKEPIFIALRYRGTKNRWITEGWWKLRFGKEVYIKDTTHYYVYYYAYDKTMTWGGKEKIKINYKKFAYAKGSKTTGRYVLFKKRKIRDTVVLSCKH